MITESRVTRTDHHLYIDEDHSRRRYQTLDHATLDQFNFICVPLHSDEVRKSLALLFYIDLSCQLTLKQMVLMY